jgi:hypothetical protein
MRDDTRGPCEALGVFNLRMRIGDVLNQPSNNILIHSMDRMHQPKENSAASLRVADSKGAYFMQWSSLAWLCLYSYLNAPRLVISSAIPINYFEHNSLPTSSGQKSRRQRGISPLPVKAKDTHPLHECITTISPFSLGGTRMISSSWLSFGFHALGTSVRQVEFRNRLNKSKPLSGAAWSLGTGLTTH